MLNKKFFQNMFLLETHKEDSVLSGMDDAGIKIVGAHDE